MSHHLAYCHEVVTCLQGPVMFDENGDRKGLTQIEQLQGSKEVRVGVYDPSASAKNKIQWEKDTPIVWIGE